MRPAVAAGKCAGTISVPLSAWRATKSRRQAAEAQPFSSPLRCFRAQVPSKRPLARGVSMNALQVMLLLHLAAVVASVALRADPTPW
jgi:hypothetical protein